VYQARETDPIWRRLTFVFLGSANLEDLIRNHSHFPSKECHNIDLHDFSYEEARVLQQGLQAACADDAERVFSRIFYWTNGHPYLTQKLCLVVANAQVGDCTDEWLDGLVEKVFLSPEASTEPNLRFAKDSIRTSRGRRQLLSCYRRVYKGKTVQEDERSSVQNRLKLLALIRGEGGTLKVRNEVYRLAFDSAWIKANMPVNWPLRIAVVAVLLTLLVVGFVSFAFSLQQQMTGAQTYIDSFRSASSPEERLISLAGLFELQGHDDEARHLFYEELSPADRSALFEVADPRAVGAQLITVVRGVYTDPRLRNNDESNAMLGAMAQPLTQLDHLAPLGATGLELEIQLWLRGREYYNGEGQYKQAIHAYDTAISLNDRNPGTYFNRAEAYVAQGETSQAFADFATAVSLDQRWQGSVQEALMSDAQLYTDLWRAPDDNGGLIALLPTPTDAPTAPPTPSPSSMPPTATPTEMPVLSTSTPPVALTSTPTTPPTATPAPTSIATGTTVPTTSPTDAPTTAPTSTATPVQTPVPPAPTPTSTSDAQLTPTTPSGTFTLLEPLSLDNPTYGPTDFVWEWTGSVPAGFGFEVRVWREGEPAVGAHDALLDNQNGIIENIDEQKYRLNTNIVDAAGVGGHSGTYLWTVALVQVSPSYADLGQQAAPGQLRLEFSGAGGEGGGSGSGGVGID
jgi:tetratricopeptide (TPR) repeat protein